MKNRQIIQLGLVLIMAIFYTLLTYAAASADVWVTGHLRNGKHVRGHYRSDPDRTRCNNWSARGNVNPHTGKIGSRKYPECENCGRGGGGYNSLAGANGGRHSYYNFKAAEIAVNVYQPKTKIYSASGNSYHYIDAEGAWISDIKILRVINIHRCVAIGFGIYKGKTIIITQSTCGLGNIIINYVYGDNIKTTDSLRIEGGPIEKTSISYPPDDLAYCNFELHIELPSNYLHNFYELKYKNNMRFTWPVHGSSLDPEQLDELKRFNTGIVPKERKVE